LPLNEALGEQGRYENINNFTVIIHSSYGR
jgi:hypothetical protein